MSEPTQKERESALDVVDACNCLNAAIERAMGLGINVRIQDHQNNPELPSRLFVWRMQKQIEVLPAVRKVKHDKANI